MLIVVCVTDFTVHDTVYKRVRLTFCDYKRTKRVTEHMDCNMAFKDSPKIPSFAETLLSLQTRYTPDTLEWCPVPCYHHLLGVGGYELLQGNFYVYLFHTIMVRFFSEFQAQDGLSVRCALTINSTLTVYGVKFDDNHI